MWSTVIVPTDLEVVEIVNETTAAALAYAYDKEFSRTAMIVDVGGGGCCISVVRVENNEVSVLACSTRQPGGENFDARMVDYLKEAIAEQHEKEVADTRSEEILRSLWVGAKVKLSRLPQTNIQTYLPEIETEFRKLLTQTEFNSECSDLFQHITTAINATLKKAQAARNGEYSPKDFTATTPSDESMDTSPVELSETNGVAPDVNGLPPAAHPGQPEVSDDVSQPPGAVQALKAASEAGSMSLLLSRAAAGGREFMSLAVRYLEPSGQPVERLVVVKEPERDGELTGDVGQLLVEPFFALCKEAGNVDWRSKLIGVSLVGSGVSKDAFLDALNRRRGEEQLKELGCGAVRLDQRLVKANELDDVILVGGSTRIVKLRELIIEAVGGGAKLYKAVNPDEVVALGAALLGAKCVQIKREVLGLHTYMTIMDSEKQEAKEHWAHSTPLPVSFSFKSLSLTICKDLEMKQGHETKTLMTVCRLPIPQKAESITINTQGTFSFRDAGKNKLCSSYLRGCLPEVTLESLKVKMQSQVKSSLVEAGRVEAKNALEDVLRQGKSWETSEDEPFPEKYSAYREMCIEKLVWLDNHADFEREEFDKIRVELEEVILSLQEESKKERHRVQEIEALTELLNKAINIEVVNDEFEERATGLRKSCQEEKEWLSENCHFSSEEYTTRKDKVNQAITALNEDRQKAAIQKLRNQLREHLQQRLRGIIKFATEKKKIKDPLDYQWGAKLETICRGTALWLKDHPEASEDELSHRTTQLERDNNILDGEIQQLKQKRDCERKAAYKNAEQTVLQGVYLKVAEFEAVSSDALKFVEMCKDYLERLKKNPHMNA
ncbi:hypothetical protein FOCC_FOCC000023, partial [Frankliniella occidentalis]